MARRVWLHVGCPKTGTSFLQGVLWSNRRTVLRQGYFLPGSLQQHYRAALYVRGAHRKRANPELIEADWERLVDAVRRSRRDVLISHELFAPATAEQARYMIESLAGEETHVIVTARDLARQLPAEWQQSVKSGSGHRLEDFVHDVVHHGPRARWFWKVQDLVGVTSRWGDTLPESNVHLVTVPPKGADPTVLWTRFAELLGIDPDAVSLDRTRSNESLGRVEVELLRRINEGRGDRFPTLGNHRWFKDLLANDLLAKRTGKQRFAVEESVHKWVLETSRDTVAALRRRGYDVVGDLDDLIPPDEPERGGSPSEVSDAELLEAATATILDLIDEHRTTVLRFERGGALPGDGGGSLTLPGRVARRLRALAGGTSSRSADRRTTL